MLPFAALVGLVVWMVAAKLLKISSLSSLLGVLGAVGSSFLIYPDIPHAPVVIIGLIILYKHTDNIIRLITGEEKAIV